MFQDVCRKRTLIAFGQTMQIILPDLRHFDFRDDALFKPRKIFLLTQVRAHKQLADPFEDLLALPSFIRALQGAKVQRPVAQLLPSELCRRNSDLRHVLSAWQYDKYVASSYFYRPLVWNAGKWQFSIYRHYSNRGLFYMSHPAGYASYKGGNNHKSDRYYADRRISKSAPKVSGGSSHSAHANGGHRIAGNASGSRASRGGVLSSGRR